MDDSYYDPLNPYLTTPTNVKYAVLSFIYTCLKNSLASVAPAAGSAGVRVCNHYRLHMTSACIGKNPLSMTIVNRAARICCTSRSPSVFSCLNTTCWTRGR